MIIRLTFSIVALMLSVGIDVTFANELNPAPEHNCDKLAAHPKHPEKVGAGVEWSDLNPENAIQACKDAVSLFPNEARFKYQLGRAFDKQEALNDAIKWYKLAAELGDVRAQFSLGLVFSEGQGIPPNHEAAAKWFGRAAKSGNAAAQANLATMYLKGHGVEQNYKSAIKWYTLAAEQEFVDAEFALGWMYIYGKDVPQDKAAGVKWLTLAANHGSSEAQTTLGVTYRIGEAVTQNYDSALKWLQLAAEQGSASAQYYLGDMYIYGQGVPRDFTRALMWWTISAANDYELAIDDMGFFDGRLSLAEKKIAEQLAKKWIEEHPFRTTATVEAKVPAPSDAEVPNEDVNLSQEDIEKGLDALLKEDFSTALYIFKLPAEQGHAQAQYFLGMTYSKAKHIPKRRKLAFKWFTRAAEQGNSAAQSILGVLYARGRGVPKDRNQAHKWLLIADRLGAKDAKFMRDLFLTDLTPTEIDMGQRLADEWLEKHPN